ncbi:MAG: carbamoyltransferase HypF [Desulfuromonadia bacterium]
MTVRRRVTVTGIVQGVGFRPFVYRLATRFSLVGSVVNSPAGVVIDIQGDGEGIERFLRRLRDDAPPLSRIDGVEVVELPPYPGRTFFSIDESTTGEPLVSIPPDSNVCGDCLAELFDPADRRFRHPFITCTNCGPRFSIIEGIPYDRRTTSMGRFPLCDRCAAEYGNPTDRRFHAEPLCCPDCGPRLTLCDAGGTPLAGDPIDVASALLGEGKVVAVKGTGGFHLAVDARNDWAVRRLRELKGRPRKPFAVMVGKIRDALRVVEVDPLSRRLLESPERPIVLLRKIPSDLSPSVAPGNRWLGVMLPSTPIQHLLLDAGPPCLVMTSGNRSDEPIAASTAEALERLSSVADFFLTHDREIVNRCDDSVIRVFRGEPLFYRRSRGYVPRPLPLPLPAVPTVALGAELKGTITLTRGDRAFVSQHLGDLSSEEGERFLREAWERLERLLGVSPVRVVHDRHPDFLTTRCAEATLLPSLSIQHHHAHFAAVLGENRFTGEAIGVIFDGTGLGEDGVIWGGEILVGTPEAPRRAGGIRPVRLPGGDQAVREPWRMGLAWFLESFGVDCLHRAETLFPGIPPDRLRFVASMIERGVSSPLTTSAGRLFDGVASLLRGVTEISYEGEAAIELEGCAEDGGGGEPLPLDILWEGDMVQLDPRPLIRDLVLRREGGEGIPALADAFHRALARGVATAVAHLGGVYGIDVAAMSGGVFQNRLLTEYLCDELQERGVRVLLHRLIPPNDACISYGQAVIASLTKGE